MKYNKPEIVMLTSALNGVQKQTKDTTTYIDSPSTEPKLSMNAYEADE
jgi:hypothetical protein